MKKYKYEVVFDVIQQATERDTPNQLAAKVRKLAPHGTYEDYRICNDLSFIIRQSGQFTHEKVRSSSSDIEHAQRIIESFKIRGLWITH